MTIRIRLRSALIRRPSIRSTARKTGGNRYFFYDLEVIEQETISTAGGEIAQLISTQSQQGGGMVCGFLARGQVLYSVDVLYLPGQEEQARETLVTALNGI